MNGYGSHTPVCDFFFTDSSYRIQTSKWLGCSFFIPSLISIILHASIHLLIMSFSPSVLTSKLIRFLLHQMYILSFSFFASGATLLSLSYVHSGYYLCHWRHFTEPLICSFRIQSYFVTSPIHLSILISFLVSCFCIFAKDYTEFCTIFVFAASSETAILALTQFPLIKFFSLLIINV